MKVHKMADSCADSDGDIDWDIVVNLVLRSELQRSDQEIKHIADFVKNASGGIKTPWILQDIVAFSNSLSVRRELQSAHLSRLASTDLGIGGKPNWVIACVKTMLCSPTATTKNESKYFQPSDFTAMSGKLAPFIAQCEDMMITANKLANNLKGASKLSVVGRMQVRLVAHVFKRPILGQFASLQEVCTKFIEEINECLEKENKKTVKNPWSQDSSSSSDDSDGEGTSTRIREMKPGAPTDADAIAHLKKLGFAVGVDIIETASQKRFTIKAIAKDKVDIASVETPITKKRVESEGFINEYTVHKATDKDAIPIAKFHWYLK